jgi:hypothetical protein
VDATKNIHFIINWSGTRLYDQKGGWREGKWIVEYNINEVAVLGETLQIIDSSKGENTDLLLDLRLTTCVAGWLLDQSSVSNVPFQMAERYQAVKSTPGSLRLPGEDL